MNINALKYNIMFIFLTLIFSTIAGNRINSFRIPFALAAGSNTDRLGQFPVLSYSPS